MLWMISVVRFQILTLAVLLAKTPSLVKHNMCLASALSNKSVQDMEVKFDTTTRQKTILGCLQAAHAQDFLLAISIDGLGKHTSPMKYCAILRYRLMIPLFPIDEVCPVCRKTCLDTFGEHAVHCKELPSFTYIRDFVRDVFFGIFRRRRSISEKGGVCELLD